MFSSSTYNQIHKDLERTWVGQLDDVPSVEALVAMLTLGFFGSPLSTGNASCLAQQKKVKKMKLKNIPKISHLTSLQAGKVVLIATTAAIDELLALASVVVEPRIGNVHTDCCIE